MNIRKCDNDEYNPLIYLCLFHPQVVENDIPSAVTECMPEDSTSEQLVDETLPEPWTGLVTSYFAPATEFPPGEVVFTIIAESLCYYYCV